MRLLEPEVHPGKVGFAVPLKKAFDRQHKVVILAEFAWTWDSFMTLLFPKLVCLFDFYTLICFQLNVGLG